MSSTPDIVERLAARLKSARKERKLTLDDLAQRSGVSRSMLSQIERGETNPTVATLWNLTRALGVDVSGLLEDTSAPGAIFETMPADRTPRIESRGDNCVIRILSPPNMAGQYELYELIFEAGGALRSSPHRQGCVEHLTVTEGAVDVASGSEQGHANTGDTIRYRADVPHAITASGGKARAMLVVVGS